MTLTSFLPDSDSNSQAGLRACQSNAQQWSLIPVAVRLADAMGLKSASSSNRLSVLDRELHRRLWFSISVLDLQSAFDRGSRTLITPSDLVNLPLDCDDTEISNNGTSWPGPNDRSTEISFAMMTFHAGICHRKLTELGISAADGTLDPQLARQQQLAALANFELDVKRTQDQCGTAPPKIQAFTLAVAQESLVAMRLLFHRPLHKRGKNHAAYDQGQIDSNELLIMATEVLDRSQSKRSWFEFAQWAWFKWVKWFALAVVLAELCTARGSSADRSWIVAQQSFDDYATIVADTNFGLLWKPIAKLMQRARSVREAQTVVSQDVVPTGHGDLINFQWQDHELRDLHSLEDDMSTFTGEKIMGGEIPITTDPDVDMSWFHWDLLIDDIETGGLDLNTQYFPSGY
jgi:hypothetical protein